MKKILVLTLVLSLCIGLGAALASNIGAAKPDAVIAWIEWTPGTPPTCNSIAIDQAITWIDWSPGTPPSCDSIVIAPPIAWIDWTPGGPPTRDIPPRI